jgi:hypothetical protein
VDATEGHVKASGWDGLVALSEAERERALARFYQLRPVLEEGVPLQRLAHDQRIPIADRLPRRAAAGRGGQYCTRRA